MDCKLRAKNCGGCPMLATEYAAQLKKKEADVRALLGKYGPVAPIRGMETPYHYRNKVISTFAPAAGGKLTSGIYAARTHKVLPVESCLLQDEVLDKVMLAVRAAANACRYQPFHEDKGTGLLRHCLLRRGVATGQVMVVLVTAQPVLPGAKNFVKACWPRPKSGASPSPPSYRTTIPAAPASFWARTKKSSTARASSSTPSAARPTPQPPQLLSGEPRPDCRALRAGRRCRPPHRQRSRPRRLLRHRHHRPDGL